MPGNKATRAERSYWFGIRTKTLFVLLTATVLALVSTGPVYYLFTQELTKEAALDHLKTAAADQGRRVAELRAHQMARARLIASGVQSRRPVKRLLDEGPNSAARQSIERTLRALADVSEVKAIYVIGSEGRVLASARETPGADSNNQPPCDKCGQNPQPTMRLRQNGDGLILQSSVPLRWKNQLAGDLIVEVGLESIKDITTDYSGLGHTSETIVAQPAPGGGFRAVAPLRYGDGKPLSALTIQPREGPDKLTLYDFVDYRGKKVLAAKLDVPGTDWIVFVKRDREEIFQRAAYLERLMGYLTAGALAIAIALALLFSSTLTTPLLKIINTTHQIANGDLQWRITESPNDEIGDLARSVNEMADRLVETNLGLEEKVRERTKALTELNDRLEQVNKELNRMARHDQLTGLLNRRVFDETFETEWNRAQRNGTPLGLILVDIDNFKRFNDCGGHDAGDGCLKTVASILSAQARRSGDVVTRYGGEEMALIMAGSDIDTVASLAEKLREAVSCAKIAHSAPECDNVSVSIGAASLVPQDEHSPAELFKRADDALYAAKKGGRNRVEAFREPQASHPKHAAS